MRKLYKIGILSVFLLFSFLALTGESYIKRIENRKNAVSVHPPVTNYSLNDSQIRAIVNKAKKLHIKVNKHIKLQTVEKLYSEIESKTVSDMVMQDENAFLKNKRFANYIPKNMNASRMIKEERNIFLGRGKVFLAISSSIPFSTLRNYVYTDARLNGAITMVLRGVIGSATYIMPTVNWIKKLLKFKGKKGYYDMHVDIDPLIIDKFHIREVPALIYVRHYNPETFMNNNKAKAYVVYGNASIEYGLKKIEEKTHSRYIRSLIKMLRG